MRRYATPERQQLGGQEDVAEPHGDRIKVSPAEASGYLSQSFGRIARRLDKAPKSPERQVAVSRH